MYDICSDITLFKLSSNLPGANKLNFNGTSTSEGHDAISQVEEPKITKHKNCMIHQLCDFFLKILDQIICVVLYLACTVS